MNFKNLLFKSALLALLSIVFVSCSDDEKDPNYWTPPLSTTKGAFILNNGNWGQDDASIAYYDKETGECSAANVFESMNGGKILGDLGQAMLIIDNKMYIAVSGSGIIYVTDLNCTVKKEIVSMNGNEPREPRAFAAYGNYVYVTYYDGYLARINRRTLELGKKLIEVGPNPEELKIANGKIYVACSGGMLPEYNNTVAVVDIASFKKTKDIEVVLNPAKIEADRAGNIYVISNGNYGFVPTQPFIDNQLSVIDSRADTVSTTLGNASYMRISPDGDKLYVINSTYSSSKFESRIYDCVNKEFIADSFVNDDVQFKGMVTALNIDPENEDIYISSSMYGFAENVVDIIIGEGEDKGKLKNRFETGGANPWGVYFVK